MKVRHGKLLPKDREQLVRDYRYRRRTATRWATCPGTAEYLEWVDGFERFMCRGLDERRVGQVRAVGVRDPVGHDAPDMEQTALADASRPNASSPQVD